VVRRTQSTTGLSFTVLLMVVFLPSLGFGQTAFVLGGGLAQDCYQGVKNNAPVRATRAMCSRALETEPLTKHDLTATLVNRGITALRTREGASALADFNAALAQDPAFSAAFLNRSGAYLILNRWLDAKVDADTALNIGLERDAWAAHFNRAVALENMGQIADAYAAFQRAAELAPNEEIVRVELARFRKAEPNS
jgi:tetratricopeptide (TPR) repeat protein